MYPRAWIETGGSPGNLREGSASSTASWGLVRQKSGVRPNFSSYRAMASASLARAGFLRSGSYQPRNMASSCGVSPLHPARRFDTAMIPEHSFFFDQSSAYVRRTGGETASPQGGRGRCAQGGMRRRRTRVLLDFSNTYFHAVWPSGRLTD